MSILGKKILGLLNKPSKRRGNTNRGVIPFNDSKNLGILFTWEDSKKESALEEFIDSIGLDKEVDVLCFNPNKEPVNSKHPTFEIGDLSALGKFNSESAQRFINKSLDYVFHFDLDLNEVTKSILVMTKAKCRVGLHSQEGARYYELMIGINKSAGIANFAEQMEKYVKAIR